MSSKPPRPVVPAVSQDNDPAVIDLVVIDPVVIDPVVIDRVVMADPVMVDRDNLVVAVRSTGCCFVLWIKTAMVAFRPMNWQRPLRL